MLGIDTANKPLVSTIAVLPNTRYVSSLLVATPSNFFSWFKSLSAIFTEMTSDIPDGCSEIDREVYSPVRKILTPCKNIWDVFSSLPRTVSENVKIIIPSFKSRV